MRPQEPANQQPSVRVPQHTDYSLVSQRTMPESARARKQQDAAADIARQQIDTIYTSGSDTTQPAQPSAANTSPNIITPTDQMTSQSTEHPVIQPTLPPREPTLSFDSPGSSAEPEPAAEPEQKPASTRSFDQRIIQPIEDTKPQTEQPAASETPNINPYERTMQDSPPQATSPDWRQYHSAWQQYYQQYFHQYYAAHLEQQAKAQPHQSVEATPEQALHDIRSGLRSTVKQRAKQVRKSRHFIPIAAALGVMLAFTFLQYNRVFFSNLQAYVMPGNIEPTNIIPDVSVDSVVGPEPLLVIPKINVEVPVVWDVTPDHESQMAAMEDGVAWFGIPGANSKPGQAGNIPVSGHSSNSFFETGDYKFVFAPLEKLSTDDMIYVNYKGTRYTYVVTKKEVVKPENVGALTYETDKSVLTLITCTPLGTALNRLLVTAEQVSPNPSNLQPAPSSDGGVDVAIPGATSNALEQALGIR